MKTYGICGKQSARKHRQRGDYVIHLRGFPGRYTWLHHDTLNPWKEKVSASQVRQEQRAEISGKRPMMFIVDEANIPVTDNDASALNEKFNGMTPILFSVDMAAPGMRDWSEEP